MRPSRLLSVLLVALAASAGCATEPAPRAVPVDDGATAVGPGGPRLSGAYDRDPVELAAALPVESVRSIYSEVQQVPTRTLRVAETNVCRAGDAEWRLPATQVTASRGPAEGHEQPESADVVAARARTEFLAVQFTEAAGRRMVECVGHTRQGRDLGEGSHAPAEQATASSEPVTVHAWTGTRHSARVQLTSTTWQDEITREWLVLHQGQIVVLVRVDGADEDAVRTEVDAMAQAVTDVLDGRARTPELPGLVVPDGEPTGSPAPTGTNEPDPGSGSRAGDLRE